MSKQRIGLVIKDEDHAQNKARELIRHIGDRCLVIDTQTPTPPPIPEDLICIVVLGGDGTFLSVARYIGDSNIPLMGIKFGEVGFLAETTEDLLCQMVDTVFKGDYLIQERSRLNIRVVRDNKCILDEDVLNDAVINKAALSRLASCAVYLDDTYLTTYRADGLIVATPTGSTAYSLAAGGPVIHPAVQGTIITPICPFTLTNRCMIVPSTDRIMLRLGEKTSDIVLTFDGQVGLAIDDQDVIHIAESPYPINMIVLPGKNYFDILKAKLRWSGGRF